MANAKELGRCIWPVIDLVICDGRDQRRAPPRVPGSSSDTVGRQEFEWKIAMAFWSKNSSAGKKREVTGALAATAQGNAAAAQPPSGSALAHESPQISSRRDGSNAVSTAGALEARSTAATPQGLNSSKGLMAALGEVISVLMRTQQFRDLPLSKIEAVVAPAVLTGQYLVAESQANQNGIIAPLAAVLWASVSSEVDSRLSKLDQPFRLAPDEWKSGAIPWLVLMAGDRRVMNPMLKQLHEKILRGRPLKMRLKGKDGKETVGTFSPDAKESDASHPE